MRTITLQVSGREMTFSEEKLVAILEKHFDTEATQQEEKDAQTTETQKQAEIEVVQTLTEGKWFEVNPTEIDQSLFSKERTDEQQEYTRQMILRAFYEMSKHPARYARQFKTMIPEKTWKKSITVIELDSIARCLGDHMADWVEQALEWAQRIANGETWKAICNDVDNMKCHRLFYCGNWGAYDVMIVGGSSMNGYYYPYTKTLDSYLLGSRLANVVPSVVGY